VNSSCTDTSFAESSSTDIKPPPFPTGNDSFANYKSKMELCLSSRSMLSVVIEPSLHIPHKTRLTSEEYMKWVKQCEKRFEKADKAVRTATKAEQNNIRKNNADVLFKANIIKNRKACELIMSTLSEKQMNVVSRVFSENAYELWKTILDNYDVIDTTDTIDSLLTSLQNVKRDNNEYMRDYISKVDILVRKLGQLGESVSDRRHKHILRRGIQHLSTWVVPLQVLQKMDSDGKMTVSELERYLINEENKQNLDRVQVTNTNAALTTISPHSNNNYRGRGRGTRGRGRGSYPFRGGRGRSYGGRYQRVTFKLPDGQSKKDSDSSNSVETVENTGDGSDKKNDTRGRGNYRGRSSYRGRGNYGYRGRNSNYYGQNDGSCHRCSKMGHRWYECTARVVDQEAAHATQSLPLSSSLTTRTVSLPSSSSSSNEVDYGFVTGNNGNFFLGMDNIWILDSAATSHHTGNISLLSNVRTLLAAHTTITGNGVSTYNQVGDAYIYCNGNKILLSDTVYISGFKANLVSIRKLSKMGCIVTFYEHMARVMRNNEEVFVAHMEQGLYIIHTQHAYCATTPKHSNVVIDSDVIRELKLMHARYGHASYSKLYEIITHNSVDGIHSKLKNTKILYKIIPHMQRIECVGCVQGKMHRSPMTGIINWNVSEQMDLWVVDIIGPMKTESIYGHKYILLIMDVHTRMLFVFVMHHKSDSLEIIIKHIKLCQTQLRKKLKQVHSDGDKAILVNNEMKKFLADNGTRATITTSYTPQHNGMIERMNRTFINVVKSMMFHANAYKSLWSECALTAGVILRQWLTRASVTKTPSEMWFNVKPSVSALHVWGCDAYYYVHKKDEKLDENAKKGIFVGYDFNNNNTYYKVYDTVADKMVVSRDVRFFDEMFNEMKKMSKDDSLTDVEKISNNKVRKFENEWLPDEYFENSESVREIFPTSQQQTDANNNETRSKENNTTNTKNGKDEISEDDNDEAIPNASSSNISSSHAITTSTNNRIVTEEDEEDIHVTLRGSNNSIDKEATHKQHNMNTNTTVSENKNKNKRTMNDMNTTKENSVGRNSETNIDGNRRSQRHKKTNKLSDYDYGGDEYAAAANTTGIMSDNINNHTDDHDNVNSIVDEPTSYNEAITCSESREWKKAINEELTAHAKNNTWTTMVIDNNNKLLNIIDTRWIFKKKRNETGQVVRFKARLVARGFTQEYGVDYIETFAPVLKMKSLRLILALSATQQRSIVQLDVKTAFLNAEVHEDIYIAIPEGMKVNSTTTVLKLNKALYGIKQAPREWNININNYLISINFKACKKDPCIYTKKSIRNNIIILGLFVDDIIVSYVLDDETEWKDIKKTMMEKYDITDMGAVSNILGMHVQRDSYNNIYVDQQTYIHEKLNTFNMKECVPVSTPGDVNIMLNTNADLADVKLYRSIIGSLIYVSVCTRPDVTHAVNICSRFMTKPTITHMQAAKRILRYLRGNIEYGLKYNNNISTNGNKVVVSGYSDADWGGDKYDRKSTTGYCTFVNGNLISWNTKKQPTVALSTAEAELMAIVELAKEVTWLCSVLEEMNYQVEKPSCILSDNLSAIKIAQNDIEHDRTKHIDIKYYYIRDEIINNNIQVKWINSQQQLADIFTKALLTPSFSNHKNKLVHPIPLSH
jgi:hypothetical protein